MVLEQIRSYRLGPTGGPSLACDDGGVTLGGIALVSVVQGDDGERRCDVRSPDRLGRILSLAYGAQPESVVERLHRGLRRVAAALEKGDLATAAIEAVMLRLPDVDAAGLAKLAGIADLEKGGTASQDEPRVPAGQRDGGQWTTGGGGGGSPAAARPPAGKQPVAGRTASPDHRQAPASAEAGADTGDVSADSGEVTAVSPVRQSRKQNANGFYPNSAGGGVFYIPSVSAGQQIRPTEVQRLPGWLGPRRRHQAEGREGERLRGRRKCDGPGAFQRHDWPGARRQHLRLPG
jgi:hypothetical protein